MKYKDFYINKIKDLLEECDVDLLEAIYYTISKMTGRRSQNGFKKSDHRHDR